MTDEELKPLIAAAERRYAALSPAAKAAHDHEQRRSFARGMCPFNRDYGEWCHRVDTILEPNA